MQERGPRDRITGLESAMVTAHQTLSQARAQSTVMHDGTLRCMERCLDLSDLFTNRRASKSISIRLKADQAEKKCITNCGAKWDELFRRNLQRLNQREVAQVQMEMMQKLQQAALGPTPK